jgi:hypothetical protein
MRRLLRRLGFRYLRGQQRNYLAETPANVAFRGQYLRAKVRNRDRFGNPIFTEVYLDESYVNEHHVSSRSWLDVGRQRYAKEGKGHRFCIIGAGIQIRTYKKNLVLQIGALWTQDGVVHGDWVPGSLRFWQSQLKGDEDYHGNFNANIFERWFQELCATLALQYGTCIIHMDGARYHKRVLNPRPTTKWRKADIQAWLT